eukprot:11341363-Alexandrium_andersonii.AAC.1
MFWGRNARHLLEYPSALGLPHTCAHAPVTSPHARAGRPARAVGQARRKATAVERARGQRAAFVRSAITLPTVASKRGAARNARRPIC